MMASFNLDTKTLEHLVAAQKVILELTETFGKENVKVGEDWKFWVSVEVKGAIAYFSGVCNDTYPNNLMLSIYEKGETKKTYKISGDLIDTIYLL